MPVNKKNTDSILIAEIKSDGFEVIFEKNSFVPHYAASLAKVFLAAELLKLIDEEKITNKLVEIKEEDLEKMGTDVLADIVGGKNKVIVDALTLMGLMIKYSCNSSALVLAGKFLPERKVMQEDGRKFWRMKNITLVGENGEIANNFSLMDFLVLFEKVYKKKGKNWDILREKLKASRNIYYLFDQLELKVLGTKSGTKKLDDIYYINDCGLFELKGKTYFMGAMVSDRSISKAVIRIREIGRNLIRRLD